MTMAKGKSKHNPSTAKPVKNTGLIETKIKDTVAKSINAYDAGLKFWIHQELKDIKASLLFDANSGLLTAFLTFGTIYFIASLLLMAKNLVQ